MLEILLFQMEQCLFYLFFNHFKMFVGFAFLQRLAAAHHGNQLLLHQTVHLLGNDLVALVKIFAAFGMPDDAELHTKCRQHRCGHFTRIGPVVELAAILRSGIKIRLFSKVRGQFQIRVGGANDHLRLKVVVGKTLLEGIQQIVSLLKCEVHLPVSDN